MQNVKKKKNANAVLKATAIKLDIFLNSFNQ